MIRNTEISRPFFSTENQSTTYDLHMFADTSMKHYCAVAYLKHGNKYAFVISKSRVKPLKEITLSRLEPPSCS